MKKTLLAVLAPLTILQGALHAQSIDYGMTAAFVQSPVGTPLPSGTGGFQLFVTNGVFTPSGSSTLSDILANMTPVPGSFTSIDPSYPAGQPYLSGITTSLATGTGLYALASTSATFALSAPWALLSGPSANGWAAPNTADPFAVSTIEFSLSGNQIISAGFGGPGTGAYFGSVGNSTAPVGVDSNLILVPEPSTYALLAMSGIGMAGYVIRRRRRA